MAIRINWSGESLLDRYLRAWWRESPTFFWSASGGPADMLRDRVSGIVGTPRDVAVPYYAAAVANPVANGATSIRFPTVAGITGSGQSHLGGMLVWVDDPTAVTGAFLKIGDGTTGIGYGCGNTNYDNSGSKIMTLRENILFGTASAANALVKGVNFIGFGRTSQAIFTVAAYPAAVEGSNSSISAWNAASNALAIQGYPDGSTRGSNVRVIACMISTQSLLSADYGIARTRMYESVRPLMRLGREAIAELCKPQCRIITFGDVAAGGGTTVDLTGAGQTATLSEGALSVATAVTFAGQTATLSEGTITPSTGASQQLSGQTATLSEGTLGIAAAVTFAGQTATLSEGTVTPSTGIIQQLSGQSVTLSEGTLGVAAAIQPSNQTATVSEGTLGIAAAVTLAGQTATISEGTITPSTGAIRQLSGQTATISEGALGVAAAVTLAGQTAMISEGTLTVGKFAQLSGLSITTSQGALALGIAVPLSSLPLSILQGTLGIFAPVDITQPLTGQQLTISQGEFALGAKGIRSVDVWAYLGVDSTLAFTRPDEEVVTT